MTHRAERFNPSILTRIVALVAAALLLALAAMMLVTFRGPPPHARPMLLSEAALLLRGAGVSEAPGSAWSITRYISDRAPSPDADQQIDVRAGAQVADLAGVPARDVRLIREKPPEAIQGMPLPDQQQPLHRAFTLAHRDGAQWRVIQAWQGANLPWYVVTLSLMAGIFLLLLAPAYWVARRITLPIRRLAEGAATERPEQAQPLPLTGPPEVRAVGAAYNHMRARIADYLNERTAMLVAIAHDLRTPMTRLSFRLEQLPDGPRAKAQADVEEMRAMVTTLLDFMRQGSEPIKRVRIDLSAIVDTLADDLADMGQDVSVRLSARAVIFGDAGALRRCIANLVENAVRYGGSAVIDVDVASGRASISVEDQGPGVPDANIDRLCEPFYRGEASRNRETGGIGLGLSIARTIAESHGGQLAFTNRAEGGLRVKLTLPLAR
ncbi:ATP-binding protein [Sphingobium abikonense]|uniref:ATP-binding protein n=1 Tax=Sphingobium abikonense TaxID=86193 RepID=UPI003518E318